MILYVLEKINQKLSHSKQLHFVLKPRMKTSCNLNKQLTQIQSAVK